MFIFNPAQNDLNGQHEGRITETNLWMKGRKTEVNIQNNIYLGACPHSGPPSGFILPAPLLGILLCGIPGGHCMLPRPMVGAGISFQWDTLPA
jgi:hypothetical protein